MELDQPNGPTQHKWHVNGYQHAMRDIIAKLDEAGPRGVAQWVADNGDPEAQAIARDYLRINKGE